MFSYSFLQRIPPLFVKTFEQILPERTLLQTKSGETWSVKIERIGEYYCFTDGWPNFVKDLELIIGDFLVFWLILGEKSIFRVAMYDITGCEKELNSSGNIDPLSDQTLSLKLSMNSSTKILLALCNLTDLISPTRIPPLFVKTFERILPEHALLQTKSGETWSVKIERIEEHYCLTDGWPKFVKDLELMVGDFLVFWLILGEKSIFKVAIYDITGCEKKLNSATSRHCPIKVETEEAIDEFGLETTRTLHPNRSTTHGSTGGKERESKKMKNRSHGAQISVNSVEDQSFTKVLAKHHQSRMKFAKKTGLIGKTEVMVQYLNGWSTIVVLKESTKPYILEMCGGWPEFRKKNRLLYGKRYAFEYIPETDSIQVQLLKGQR
ncbi:hypothetical protein ACH5RR_014110 [Cinchona calisaya]|uniref:TF-B3 domain-containing protein n=1 Tax=Cinchona calisaya TaxID=153742 RepID=A0ABD3A7S6_9GENT